MRKDKLARISLYLFLFGYGLTVTLVSPLVSDMISDFSLSQTEGGLINTFYNIGGFVAIAALLFLSSRIKKGWIFMIAAAIFVIMMYVIGGASDYTFLIVFMLIMGIGAKTVDTICNALLSDRYPVGTAGYMNMMHMVFSIGAFSAPIIIGLLRSGIAISWRNSYILFGAICTALLLFFIICWRDTGKSDRDIQKNTDARPASQSLFRDAEFWVVCVIVSMYMFHQMGVTYWSATYFQSHSEVPRIVADFSISVLWIGIVVSRALAVKFGKPNIIVPWVTWGSLLGGALLIISVLMNAPYFVLVSYFIAGVCTGSLFPMLIGRINSRFPAHTGTASTVIYVFVTAACAFSTVIMGGIADVSNMQTAMLMGGIPLVIIVIVSLIKYRGGIFIKKEQ